ncbi:MAG: restriction endonuclease subunit S, partial [Anaerolineales bacterium]
ALVPALRFPEFRDAGEWEEKPLGKLLSVGNGRDHKHLPDGDIPVYGSGGYMRSVNDYLYNGESVCIGRKGTIDKPVFLAGKFWTVDTLFYTHSFKSCLPRFVYSLFQNIEWKKHNEAGGVPSLSKTNIEKIAVLVPKRVNEQQKIADCLSSLDVLIAAQTEKIDALKTHKKGLMQQLFPRDGETVPRLRFPEFRGAGEWEVKVLKDIARISSGGTPNRAEPAYWGGSVPWITTSLIDFNKIDSAEEFITTEGLNNSSAKLFPAQTLLMAMYGQGKTRGKVALLGIDATTNQACAAVMFNDEVNTNFAFQNLASRYDEIRKLSNEGGQENLSAGLIKSIPLAHPCLSEQQKIADCLFSVDDLITAQAQKIVELKSHKKGLMQQLFPSSKEIEG